MPFNQHAGELIAYPLPRHLASLCGQALDGRECVRFNRVLEAGGKADSAQHAQFVFGKAEFGIADGTDDLRRKVAPPTQIVKNLVLDRVEQKAINREVAALDVLAGIA